jgi:5'-nucleotidase/UDP-sugar diphosphatase
MFKKIFMISVIGAFAALGGCSGDDGSPGAPGAIGPAGPQGEVGPQGIAGTDAGASFDLTILHLNDTHSNITGDDFDYDVSGLALETTNLDGTAIREVKVLYGGYPRVTTAMRIAESQSPNVLKLHAGDAITGTNYYSLFKGGTHISPDAIMMNRICFDAFTVGNHEFDDGDSGLADFLSDLNSSDCITPVLSANIVPAPTSPLQGGYIQPYVITERGGVEIAIVGSTTKRKTEVSSQPDAGTTLLEELPALQSTIDEVVGLGVEHIILLTHSQYDVDLTFATGLTGVDVIVGGDSHSLLGDSTLTDLGFTPDGPYPTMATNLDGNPVCIVQAWENTHAFGALHVNFSEGTVTSCHGNAIMPIDNRFEYEDSDGEDKFLAGTDVTTIVEDLTSEDEFVHAIEDQIALDHIATFDAQVGPALARVIGTASVPLCYERVPGQGRSSIDGCTASTYQHGSDITTIFVKSMIDAIGSADIAIQNGGGLRIDIPSGDITLDDIYTLLPYSNTIVEGDMTGQAIIAVLENAISNFEDTTDGSTGSYPYAYGLRFDVDASQTFGSRISNVEVNSRVAGNWTPIDLNATYRVVTNSFTAGGRDNYIEFADVTWNNTYTEYRDPLMRYIENLTSLGQSVAPLSEDVYSTKSFIDRNGCNHAIDLNCASINY